METMRYINIPTPGEVQISDMPKPVPHEGEVLLKLLWGGICGSDLGTYKGTFLYASYPRIPGHEFSAEIAEVGEGVTGLDVGMVVTSNPYYNCGTCYSCKRGFVNCCMSLKTLGAQTDGAFRQYLVVPAARVYDGKGLDAQELALVEAFCISYHAVKRVAPQKGERVLVVGAGPIGIFALMAARTRGAEVYVSDVSRLRLDKALSLGAAGVIDLGCADFDTRVRELTDGDGFDVCIECAGLPQTFQNCIDATAFRGRIAVVGVGKQNHDFRYTVLQTKELDIHGSRNALKEDFIEVINLVQAGVFDLKAIITDVYDFDDAAQAFADLAAKGDTMLKAMIRF